MLVCYVHCQFFLLFLFFFVVSSSHLYKWCRNPIFISLSRIEIPANIPVNWTIRFVVSLEFNYWFRFNLFWPWIHFKGDRRTFLMINVSPRLNSVATPHSVFLHLCRLLKTFEMQKCLTFQVNHTAWDFSGKSFESTL